MVDFFFIVVQSQWSQFFPVALPCPAQLPPHSLSHSPPCCPLPWIFYMCPLTRPFLFPLLSFSPLPSGHCQCVHYFHVSGSILLICLFCWWGEIIWYLSFTTWLISLSIMLSISIYAVLKGRAPFFLLYSILLCKCTAVFWCTHLLIGA